MSIESSRVVREGGDVVCRIGDVTAQVDFSAGHVALDFHRGGVSGVTVSNNTINMKHLIPRD